MSETTEEQGFRLTESNEVVRVSDGEVMANYDPETRQIVFTHHSRERNFGDEIRALIAEETGKEGQPAEVADDKMPAEVAEVQEPEPDEPGELVEPPRCPQAGSYTLKWLGYDFRKLTEKKFLKKWGGDMSRGTLIMVREAPKEFKKLGEKIAKTINENV